MLRRTAPSTAVQIVSCSSATPYAGAVSRLRQPLGAAIVSASLGLVAMVACLFLGAEAKAASYYWFGDDNNFWNQIVGPGGTNWSSSPDFNNGAGGATALPSSTSP
jgi:hypothetical protein